MGMSASRGPARVPNLQSIAVPWLEHHALCRRLGLHLLSESVSILFDHVNRVVVGCALSTPCSCSQLAISKLEVVIAPVRLTISTVSPT